MVLQKLFCVTAGTYSCPPPPGTMSIEAGYQPFVKRYWTHRSGRTTLAGSDCIK
jgi:hypothetical protein